jgi:hypothetical protein
VAQPEIHTRPSAGEPAIGGTSEMSSTIAVSSVPS